MVTSDGRVVPRFVVLEGPSIVVGRRLRAAVSAVRADGWTVVRGWAAPLGREPVVCAGFIATADDARRALLAAISGAGLIVGAKADRDTIDRFLDDLRRLGPVAHLAGSRPSGELARLLVTSEQRALLGLLGEGLSVRDAAASIGLSRRAADRRLATARTALGVDSTAGAIVAALGTGIDRRPHHGPDVRSTRWPGGVAAARADAAGDRGRGPP